MSTKAPYASTRYTKPIAVNKHPLLSKQRQRTINMLKRKNTSLVQQIYAHQQQIYSRHQQICAQQQQICAQQQQISQQQDQIHKLQQQLSQRDNTIDQLQSDIDRLIDEYTDDFAMNDYESDEYEIESDEESQNVDNFHQSKSYQDYIKLQLMVEAKVANKQLKSVNKIYITTMSLNKRNEMRCCCHQHHQLLQID